LFQVPYGISGGAQRIDLVDDRRELAGLDKLLQGQQVLLALGLWTAITPEAEPILEIRVADNDSPLHLHFNRRELGCEEPLGYIVENQVLRRAFLAHARALPSLEFLARRTVAAVEADGAAASVRLSDGRRLRTRLVAAADGQRSRLREAAHIRTMEWCYPQTAITTTVRHERPHGGIAIEHFFPAGPFAILPMTQNRSSVVWTEDTALAPRLLSLPDAEFAAELRARFGDYLGAVEPIGPRWSYPLALMQAARYCAPRLALVGEAAHVIHPIAGQGLNLGIRDVAALSELVIDARRLGLDIGDAGVLQRYQQWRRFDAVLLAAVTDGLNRLFSNSLPPFKLARDLGLAAVDRMPPLKRLFMRHAMGIVGELPRLARGQPL
jgi:2-octaprenyl-6-methoxyphenol hydroxylase